MREVLNRYGMLLVLVALCALFSVLTLKEQMPDESAAAAELVERIDEGFIKTATIIALGAKNTELAAGARGAALPNEPLAVKLASILEKSTISFCISNTCPTGNVFSPLAYCSLSLSIPL